MSTLGPNYAGTGVDNDAVGILSWVNPENITISGDVRASIISVGISESHYLKATNFGFNIPVGATINGITIEIEKLRSGGLLGQIKDSKVRIIKSGNVGSVDKANPDDWPTSESFITHGGSSDLWGETWTSDEINSSNFGVVISCVGSIMMTDRIANVDSVRITVSYTLSNHLLLMCI